MSKFYQSLDAGHFDYQLVELGGGAQELVRGPAIDPAQPYIVCLGAAQTFGRFCHRPFPSLLSDNLGIQVLNLGLGGSGPSAFLKPHYKTWLNGAKAVVVQVLSGRSESNSLFDNSVRGGLRGIRVSDGLEMRFEQFLSELMVRAHRDVVEQIVRETRDNYVRNMIELLDGIGVPKILLWISGRSPRYTPDYRSPWTVLGGFPHLVDDQMLERILPHTNMFVECTVSQAPQRLWSADRPIDGAILTNGCLYNLYYPSPETHFRAASMLTAACRTLLLNPAVDAATIKATAAAQVAVRFIILCAERTGSTLLSFMLDSHKNCFAAGELFNSQFLNAKVVPGFPAGEQERLNSLRERNVAEFLREVYEGNERQGYAAVGFKLMYGQGESNPLVIERLAADKELRVIHLRRRNQLQRFISLEQARKSGVWAQGVNARPIDLPDVEVDFNTMIKEFLRVEERDAKFSTLFGDHPVMDVFYEDIAAAPENAGKEVAKFLGLSSEGPLKVAFRKTGNKPMRSTVSNYDVLKKRLQNWVAHFDE